MEWSEKSGYIKISMIRNNGLNNPYIDFYQKLFNKYKTNIPLGTTLYRGMPISNESYIKDYKMLKKGDLYCPHIISISSFSKDSSISMNFAQSQDKSHVHIFISMISNGEELLDISEYSRYPNEQEVIMKMNLCYTIENIKDSFIYSLNERWIRITLEPYAKGKK